MGPVFIVDYCPVVHVVFEEKSLVVYGSEGEGWGVEWVCVGVDSSHSKRRLNSIESYESRMRKVHPFDFLPYNGGQPMLTVVHVGRYKHPR